MPDDLSGDAALLSRLSSTDEQELVTVMHELLNRPMSSDSMSDIDFVKRLGPHVNKIRKMPGMKEAGPLATRLLQQWKPILQASAGGSSTSSPGSASAKSDVKAPQPAKTTTTTQQKSTRDPIRVKSIDLFNTVLKNEELSQDIEEAIYDQFNSVSADYRAKVRSKYLNLKQNPSLPSQLTSRLLTPTRFVSMSAAEMASTELREADALAAAKALRDTQAACDTEAETDQFKCGRCGKRKCKYYQLQTRSADEPMTTFVTCVNCGNRWKFS
jgi:transcription elongation factor S-II